MRFIDSLSELNGMCCDRIVSHDDILLQQSQNTQFGNINEYKTTIQAYRLDNGTLINEVTGDFDTLVTIQSNGKLLITVTSKRMNQDLCDVRCFYLRVQVVAYWDAGGGFELDTKIFDKYTSCFKIENCCIVPSGITTQAVPETTT